METTSHSGTPRTQSGIDELVGNQPIVLADSSLIPNKLLQELLRRAACFETYVLETLEDSGGECENVLRLHLHSMREIPDDLEHAQQLKAWLENQDENVLVCMNGVDGTSEKLILEVCIWADTRKLLEMNANTGLCVITLPIDLAEVRDHPVCQLEKTATVEIYAPDVTQRYRENLTSTVLGPRKQQGLFDLLTSAAIKVKETNDGKFVIYVTADWGCSFGRESGSEFFADAKADYFFTEAELLMCMDRVILDKTACEFLHLEAAVFIGDKLYFKKRPIIVNARATRALIALADTLEHAQKFGASLEYAGDKIVVTPITPM